MTLRSRLQALVSGLPSGSSVTLPVEAIRRWLEEEPEAEPDRLFTVQDLASRYDRSPSTVREWLASGEIEGFKVRGSWRATAEAVAKHESGRQEGAALGRGRPADLSAWREAASD